VVAQLRGLVGDSLEDVIDKGVHDAHGLARDTSVWVDLLQDLVDVDGIGFLPSLSTLFLVCAFGDSFLGSLRWGFNYVLSSHFG